MDLRMGDLDGLEATRRLAATRRRRPIPVIAVTASAWGEVRQAARDAGCVDYLPKPVRAEGLFAMLQSRTSACGSSARQRIPTRRSLRSARLERRQRA